MPDVDGDLVTLAVSISRNHPALLAFWSIWAIASSPDVVMLGALSYLALRWRRGSAAGLRRAALILIIGRGVAPALKLAVGRPRPQLAEPVAAHSGYSFPSGHATYAALAATTLMLVCWPALRGASRKRRTAVTVLAAGCVVLTALDRVFLGAHYPSDVFAGAVIGAGFAVLAWWFAGRRSVARQQISPGHGSGERLA